MRRALWIAAAVLIACAPLQAGPAPLPATERAEPAAREAPIATPVPTAEPTPSPAPALSLPHCPGERSAARFALCVTGARIDVDAVIGEADASAIVAQVADDLEAVQREFEWRLARPARIDIYADTERYAAGLREVFGYSRATATFVAENSVAFFEPALVRIAVNWEAVSDRRPIAALRHELTHVVTLEACAPRCDLVPAWLNEGQARLAEAHIGGADWRLMRVRYEAASMVATNTLMPLTSLWTQAQWNALGDWSGYYKYQQAARAMELFRADVGERAIARLYARIRAGEDVPSAYARLSGKSFASFSASLAARVTENVVPGPGIAVVTPGPDGSGAGYLLYGFASEAKVTLTVRSRHRSETREVGVSPQGAHFASIDASYPPGEYTITAASDGVLAAVSVVKRGGRPLRASAD